MSSPNEAAGAQQLAVFPGPPGRAALSFSVAGPLVQTALLLRKCRGYSHESCPGVSRSLSGGQRWPSSPGECIPNPAKSPQSKGVFQLLFDQQFQLQ